MKSRILNAAFGTLLFLAAGIVPAAPVLTGDVTIDTGAAGDLSITPDFASPTTFAIIGGAELAVCIDGPATTCGVPGEGLFISIDVGPTSITLGFTGSTGPGPLTAGSSFTLRFASLDVSEGGTITGISPGADSLAPGLVTANFDDLDIEISLIGSETGEGFLGSPRASLVFTIEIQPAGVPAPGVLALMTLGLGVLGVTRRRRSAPRA